MENREEKGTALDHIISRVPVAYPHQTVAEVLKMVREGEWESAHHVFVVNSRKDRRFLGVLSTRIILQSPDETQISEIFDPNYPAVGYRTHEDQVAILAIKKDLDAVPVVRTETGKFLGTVDSKELMQILHEFHTDRILRKAGIVEDGRVLNIFRARIGTLVRLRLPWLLVGLFGGMITTLLVSRFEPLLQEVIALAFFIPIIAYMNDATGTQSATLFIRNMILEKVSIVNYIFKELTVGVTIGAVLGLLIFAFALIVFGSVPVATTVGISMFLGISESTVIAISVPYLFHRFGKDPAFGSDPLVTIIQDTISVLIYFIAASILVL